MSAGRVSPLVPVAFALALLAPALVAYVATHPAARHAPAAIVEPLEGTQSVVPGFDVALAGDPVPTGVTVSARYVLAGIPGATEARKLLFEVAAQGTVPPRVEVTLYRPDGGVAHVTLDGVLSIAGEPTTGLTIRVLDGADTPLVATASPAAIDVTIEPLDLRVQHAIPAISQAFDATGDPTALLVANPLDDVAGVPSGILPADVPDLLAVTESPEGVALALLGHAATLPGAVLEGDALLPEGLAAMVGDSPLVTIRAYPPASVAGALRVELEGPAVALLEPGRTRAVLHASLGALPLGLVALALGDADAGTDETVRAIDAATGGALLTIGNDARGVAWSAPGASEAGEALGKTLAFDASADATGVVTIVGTSAAGAEAARLVIAPGEPARATLSFGPGWPAVGEPTIDATASGALGLAAFLVGGTASPVTTALAVPGELPFFTARLGDDGSVRVAYPGGAEQIPDGAIAIDGNPFARAPWSIRVEQAGSPALIATVNRDDLLPGSRLSRPSVTIDNAFAPEPVTVAPPIAIEGDLAERRLTAVRVYSPADPTQVVAGIERSGTGFLVTTPAGSEDYTSGALQYSGDPIAGDVATFTLVGAQGAPSLSVNRATGAIVATGVGEEPVTLAGPVAYSGDPLNPDLVAVASPASATPVLRYQRAADGQGSLALNGETVVPATRLLALEGDPRSPSFAFVLTGPDGAEAKRFEVSAANALLDAALPADERRPIVSLLEAGAESPVGLVDVADAVGNVADYEVLEDGVAWLGLAPPHKARVALRANGDDWTRITLVQEQGGSAAFERTIDGATRVYEASFAPGVGHAKTARLAVRYERELSPLVVQAFEESGYAYRVDGRGPKASVRAPAEPEGAAFDVAWSATDAESGVAAFTIERREGALGWERWLDGTRAAGASFTGEPGVAYSFRARATDAAGNVGAWSALALVEIPAEAEPSASPPTVVMVAPEGGETLAGVVRVAWEAADADGATPMVNLYASRDGGRSWKALYSGLDGAFAWDTTSELDGTNWKLRVVATDGAQDALDATGRFTIKNLAGPLVPDLPGGGAGAGEGGGAGGAGSAGGASGVDGSAAEPLEGAAPGDASQGGSLTEALGGKTMLVGVAMGVLVLALVVLVFAVRRK